MSNAAKTPEQIAKIFGCTVEQARTQIVRQVESLRADLEKCRASKSGKFRGLTIEWYESRLTAFSSVL